MSGTWGGGGPILALTRGSGEGGRGGGLSAAPVISSLTSTSENDVKASCMLKSVREKKKLKKNSFLFVQKEKKKKEY